MRHVVLIAIVVAACGSQQGERVRVAGRPQPRQADWTYRASAHVEGPTIAQGDIVLVNVVAVRERACPVGLAGTRLWRDINGVGGDELLGARPTDTGRTSRVQPCESEPLSGALVRLASPIGIAAEARANLDGSAQLAVARDDVRLFGGDLELTVDGLSLGRVSPLAEAQAALLDATGPDRPMPALPPSVPETVEPPLPLHTDEDLLGERRDLPIEDEERVAQARSMAHTEACHALCISAIAGEDTSAVDREPRLLDWMAAAWPEARACIQRYLSASSSVDREAARAGQHPVCTALFQARCRQLCRYAPRTDPSATVAPRMFRASTSVQEFVDGLASDLAGFRIGMTPSQARGHCRSLGGRLDESALSPRRVIACEGSLPVMIDGQPLPSAEGATLRFCRTGRLCAITVGITAARAGRGGIGAHRTALMNSLRSILGEGTTRSDWPLSLSRWTVGTRASVEVMTEAGGMLIISVAIGSEAVQSAR